MNWAQQWSSALMILEFEPCGSLHAGSLSKALYSWFAPLDPGVWVWAYALEGCGEDWWPTHSTFYKVQPMHKKIMDTFEQTFFEMCPHPVRLSTP